MYKLEELAFKIKEGQQDTKIEIAFKNLVNQTVNIESLRQLAEQYLPYSSVSKPLYERIIEIRSEDIKAIVSLGWIYWFEGEDDESRRQFEIAEKIDPTDVEVLILKAALTKEVDDKINIYQLILEKEPGHEIAKGKLKELVRE